MNRRIKAALEMSYSTKVGHFNLKNELKAITDSINSFPHSITKIPPKEALILNKNKNKD